MTILFTCELCSSQFKKRSGAKGRFCSYLCSRQAATQQLRANTINQHIRAHNKFLEKQSYCSYCNLAIPYYKKLNQFCSRTCSAIYHNKQRDPISYKKAGDKLREKAKAAAVAYTKIKWCKITGKPVSKFRPYDSDPWYQSRKIRTIMRLASAFDISLRTKDTSTKLSHAYDVIKQMYEHELLGPKQIADNLRIKKDLVYYILKLAGVDLRDNLSATTLHNLTQELPPRKNQYKTGYHRDWCNTVHYYRSSYEQKVFNQLDQLKVTYESESVRIIYYDKTTNRHRVAIPDIILDKSIIIEVKSTYTYDKTNMQDKWTAYKELGYSCILVLDHVWYSHLV